MGSETDLLRGEELKLRYDHKLGRRRASSAVDIEKERKGRASKRAVSGLVDTLHLGPGMERSRRRHLGQQSQG